MDTEIGLSPDIIFISTPCSLKYFSVSPAEGLILSFIIMKASTSILSFSLAKVIILYPFWIYLSSSS